jgi:alternate signal-mediated exported protein
MESRKKTAVLAGVVVTAALIASGTWAYTNFVQKVTNPFDGKSSAGVRLHDDFEAVTDAEPKEYNKDVYVENYGVHAQFVRVKLFEYWQMDTATYPTNADATEANIEGTWSVHKPDASDNILNPGGDTPHGWWTWTLGGQIYYHFTTCKDDNPDDDQPKDVAETDGTDCKATDVDTYTGTKLEALEDGVTGQTLMAQVTTITKWQALSDADKASYVGWVYDNDGWAYWAKPLQPGEATGLLLDAVTLSKQVEATKFDYRIHVKLEAATSDDIAKFNTDGRTITSDAAALLAYYHPQAPVIKQGMGDITATVGGSGTYELDLSTVFEDPNYGDKLSYSLVNDETYVQQAKATPTITDGKLSYTPSGDTTVVLYVKATDSTSPTPLVSPVARITLTVSA